MKKILLIAISLLALGLYSGCQVTTATEATVTITNYSSSVDITGFYIVPAGTSAVGATNQLTSTVGYTYSHKVYGVTDCDTYIDLYWTEDDGSSTTTYSRTNEYLTCGKDAYLDVYSTTSNYTEQ